MSDSGKRDYAAGAGGRAGCAQHQPLGAKVSTASVTAPVVARSGRWRSAAALHAPWSQACRPQLARHL